MSLFQLHPKRNRVCSLVFLLHLGIAFQGCALLGHLDGSSPEELRNFRNAAGGASKQETKALKSAEEVRPGEIETLRDENEKLRTQVASLQQMRNDDLNEISRIKDEIDSLARQVDRLTQENLRIQERNKVLEQELAALQPRAEKGMRNLKIKVLSSNDDMTSARAMAKKLETMDYAVQSVDRAPRSDFSQDTIYFAPRVENEAKGLAAALGGNVVCKPLTWFSIFDLIVVTGGGN